MSDFEPDYSFWWKEKSITKEDYTWVLLGIDPEAARRSLEIERRAESERSAEDQAYYSRFEYETFIQRRRYRVIIRLDWKQGKEEFKRAAYEDGHEFPDKLVLFLNSINKMPHDPNLEKYKEHSRYTACLSEWCLNNIEDENTALPLLLGLNPTYFTQFQDLQNRQDEGQKTGTETPYYTSFSSEEKWLFIEYNKFLKKEFPSLMGGHSAFYPISASIRDAKCLANWTGNFEAYVQELHDNGVLFRPETYAALEKHKISLPYTENGWSLQFYRRWLRQGTWSLKTAAGLYLGQDPSRTDRGFIILGHTGLHGSGAGLALESAETIAEYDHEGKFLQPPEETLDDIFSENQETQQWYILEKFVKGHIEAKNITPANEDTQNPKFLPIDIVEFFRTHFPRTFQPKALYIALGIETQPTEDIFQKIYEIRSHIISDCLNGPPIQAEDQNEYNRQYKLFSEYHVALASTLKEAGFSISKYGNIDRLGILSKGPIQAASPLHDHIKRMAVTIIERLDKVLEEDTGSVTAKHTKESIGQSAANTNIKKRKTPFHDDIGQALQKLKNQMGETPSAHEVLKEMKDNKPNYEYFIREDKNAKNETVIWYREASGKETTMTRTRFDTIVSQYRTGKKQISLFHG